MPQMYLCFLWHMHQPFYKDLMSEEYKLPWTRLHALKDYYGMVRILDEFPRVRQTFNLVPSMVVQVEEYAAGKALDPSLHLAGKAAEELTAAEQDFILNNFFHAYPPRMIYRFPRYGELYDAWNAQRGADGARRNFGVQEFRDLQVLSQVAWFDEYFHEGDPEVRALVEKGARYSLADQALGIRKQVEIMGLVVPTYQRLAAAGQIEISTTPFYHPILPLICDSDIAAVSHPGVALPSRFRYPADAREQLERARAFTERAFGTVAAGLWPSEGSVSDETFAIASETGFQWAGTDSGVLSRTLGHSIGAEPIYRPYVWRNQGREIGVIFRDHFLSDLIGFVYSRMGAAEAAADFLQRIRENCRSMLNSGRDALVPIILDGENAWEYYERNGRPFLRELYSRISADPQMTATTISDALRRVAPEPLNRIFPGSWISANFDVWIGAEEDNKAWEHLLRARQTYDVAEGIPEQQRKLAFEELLICEGSDWCWWYGPEHESAHRVEFDQLYRSHLANVYRALGRVPPEELSRPLLKFGEGEVLSPPTGPISVKIDGEVSSYFEWIGAGSYRVDARSGSMHGKVTLVRELYYGSDGTNLFVRVDFRSLEDIMPAIDVRINLRADTAPVRSAVIHLEGGAATVAEPAGAPVACAAGNVLEIGVPLAWLGAKPGKPLGFQLSFWQRNLPVDAVPSHGWLKLTPGDRFE
jgi:alpha-amylase/alpha-mannosidase (GH57 family)